MKLIFIRGDSSCAKCRKVQQTLEAIRARYGKDIEIKVLKATDPEAKPYAPLLVPMLIIEGKLLTAGTVPSFEKLVGFIGEMMNRRVER